MPIEDFDLVGSYNNQRFSNIDAERTINMFEYIDPKGKKPKCLISTSGIENTEINFPDSLPTDGFRMEFVLNEFEYFVVGSNLYRRNSQNAITRLNNNITEPILFSGTGYVGVDANNAANNPQLLIVDGQKGHVYDTGTGVFTYDIKRVDPAFPDNPIDVCFIDGFLIVAHGGTNEFQLSGLNNAYSWGLVARTYTADSATDLLTITGLTTLVPTGLAFQFTNSGGTLPTANPTPPGIALSTTYYAINISPTTIKIATSFANAIAGIAMDILTNGTPTNTITLAGNDITQVSGFVSGQLQLGSINSHPGDIVACRTLHRRVFFFSSNYTEVWENSGIGTNLPLRRNNGLLMEYGTPAIGSIVTGFDKMIFLSQDRDGLGAVMEVIGTESIPISNRALDFQLSQYAQILDNQGNSIGVSDARGIFVKENGIIFYRLNFTVANHTFVYNDTLSNSQTEDGKLWHEEQILNGNRHPAQTHGYFNGNNYYGSYNKPILYLVDQTFTKNDGEAIPRIRIGRCYVPSVYSRTRIDRFMIDAIQGQLNVENISGILDLLAENGAIITTENGLNLILDQSTITPIIDITEPPVFFSYSKDGGVSYGNLLTSYLGAIGHRTHRTVWRKLGVVPRGQGFVPKIEFYSNVPFTVLGAAWFYEMMPE